jgi:hypothetical protein
MRQLKLLTAAALLGAVLAGTAATAEEITVKMWARADRSGP